MSYENATASGPLDLLDKLVTFLSANGWTTDFAGADSHGNPGHTSNGARAHLHKGGVYANLRALNNEPSAHPYQASIGYGLGLILGSGFSSITSGVPEWYQMPGGPVANGDTVQVGAGLSLPSGTVNYHFFIDETDDNVVVVIEKSAGIFVHIGWGTSLRTAGSITGGPYFFGSSAIYSFWNNTGLAEGQSLTARCPMSGTNQGESIGFVRCDVDAFTSKWLSLSSNATALLGYTGKIFRGAYPDIAGANNEYPNYQNFSDRQVSSLNSMANLLPLHLFAVRDSAGHSLIGTVPNVFYTNAIGKGFSAGSDYTLGPDDYMLFTNFAVRKVG